MIPPIRTPRLRLESLSVECLEALIAEDLQRVRKTIPFRMTVDTSLAGQLWISRRLDLIRKDASHHPWMYRAIVREADNEMVGYISCHHGFPDPDLLAYSDKGIELGYTIEPIYRRRGYARESILGLITWALEERESAEVFVTISPENEPSLELAKYLGFVKIGEKWDDTDGLEIVFRHPNKTV